MGEDKFGITEITAEYRVQTLHRLQPLEPRLEIHLSFPDLACRCCIPLSGYRRTPKSVCLLANSSCHLNRSELFLSTSLAHCTSSRHLYQAPSRPCESCGPLVSPLGSVATRAKSPPTRYVKSSDGLGLTFLRKQSGGKSGRA